MTAEEWIWTVLYVGMALVIIMGIAVVFGICAIIVFKILDWVADIFDF